MLKVIAVLAFIQVSNIHPLISRDTALNFSLELLHIYCLAGHMYISLLDVDKNEREGNIKQTQTSAILSI